MRIKSLCCALLALAVLCSCAKKSAEDRFVEDLLSRMTLEEKIGQMNQLDPSYDSEAKEALIREGKVGSIFNTIGPKEVNRLQRMAVEETRLGIPLVVARDVIHGFRTIYPIPLGQGATWDPDLVEQAARLTAQEAVSAGVRWAFSPMVDVARDPRWGRVAEGYGEDPLLTSMMGAATVRGYQSPITYGKSQIAPPALAACVKHFAGYSASEGGRDYNTTWIPETLLRDIYLPPFKAALDAGAMSVMCSFNALNGLPSSANKHLNIDILRDEWHSDALLVSDWGSGSDLVPHGLCADKKEATLRCINARMEMDMQGNIYTDYLAQLVEEEKIKNHKSEIINRIDECVRSILRFKYRLGLFDNPYVPEEEPVAYTPEALDLATRVAEQSAILLKNNGVLPLNAKHKSQITKTKLIAPLRQRNHKSQITNHKNEVNRALAAEKSQITNDKSQMTILITGPLADRKKEQLGTWIFDGEPEHSVTPLEAFRKWQMVNGKCKIIYDSGLTYSREKTIHDRAQLLAKARQADVILYFCGEEAILSGEARCRADLNLPGAQRELMDLLAASGKPVVMIVMAGRPLTIGAEVEKAAAVLYAFHGGTMAGPALCNLITGQAVPCGKTPMTFPKMVGQVPLYYNRLNTGRPTYEPPVLIDDIPVGAPQFSVGYSSCWLETATEPLFPFGFGLSYTTFEYGETTIDTIVNETQSTINRTSYIVKSSITNTGNWDAYEVAQLYSRQRSGDLARPICELKGFQKIFIPAGESRTVTFTLTPEDLGYWHEEHDGLNSRVWYATDHAEFQFRIAPHSAAVNF